MVVVMRRSPSKQPRQDEKCEDKGLQPKPALSSQAVQGSRTLQAFPASISLTNCERSPASPAERHLASVYLSWQQTPIARPRGR